jgi:uncharacterized membrane protein (DUF2068 family)
MGRRKRPDKRYELLTPADATLVREAGGTRWYRCLRCDAWITADPPVQPARERMPPRAEIQLPARGPVLRDRYVLRLIAVDRAIHVVVLTVLALVLFTFARHDAALRRDYVDVMNDLSGGNPGEAQLRGILGYLRRAFAYTPRHLVQLGLLVTAYAALEATEMVGLWLNKRWAEYLTLVATTLLVPFEIYELTLGISVFKVITLVINVAIVVYLLFAKRLFGLRGGHRVDVERRRSLSGWDAVDRATPPLAMAASASMAGGPVPPGPPPEQGPAPSPVGS